MFLVFSRDLYRDVLGFCLMFWMRFCSFGLTERHASGFLLCRSLVGGSCNLVIPSPSSWVFVR